MKVTKHGFGTSEISFSDKQMDFVIEVIISAALDRIESCVPPCVPADEYGDKLASYVHGAIETAGMALATLYAQLNGEGMAICDAISIAGLDKAVEKFIENRRQDQNHPLPAANEIAATFIKEALRTPA